MKYPSAALVAGMEQLGLQSFRVEFSAAMHLIFQDEGTIERWFSGEDAFRAAKIG